MTLSQGSSCSKKSSKEDPAPVQEGVASAVQAAPSAITIDAAAAQPDQGAIPHAHWDQYFADFKTAALARDKVALAAVVAIGEHIDQGAFDDFTTIYLEFESALFFYFKKIDGQFKLFRLLAAG